MSKRISRYALAALITLIALSATAAQSQPLNPQSASNELHQGAEAYKAGHYDEAIVHFRNATQLDPKSLKAHLYLATAHAQQYIPGAETADNLAHTEAAISEFKTVLALDPQNLDSMKGIAYLYRNMRRYEDAQHYYELAIDTDPRDPETYFASGVIDWTVAYRYRMELRSQSGIRATDTIINSPICNTVRGENWERVEHGIEMLQQALKLRPDYDDVMAYLNLMYRERADMRCGDVSASEADRQLADEWMDKTIAVKKAKSRQHQPAQQNP